MPGQRSTDAPQNMVEFMRWRAQKEAYGCEEWYLAKIDHKWRTIGKLAKDPSALRGIENHN